MGEYLDELLRLTVLPVMEKKSWKLRNDKKVLITVGSMRAPHSRLSTVSVHANGLLYTLLITNQIYSQKARMFDGLWPDFFYIKKIFKNMLK